MQDNALKGARYAMRLVKVVGAVFAMAILFVVFAILMSLSSVIYTQPLSAKTKITIRALRDPEPDKIKLEITYHYPPAIGMYAVSEQSVARPSSPMNFSHVADQASGLQCIYDNNDLGFLLLFDSSTEDLWISAGPSGGRHGTSRDWWQKQLNLLRRKHPMIPYKLLPDHGN
jgi:hypothetical protein